MKKFKRGEGVEISFLNASNGCGHGGKWRQENRGTIRPGVYVGVKWYTDIEEFSKDNPGVACPSLPAHRHIVICPGYFGGDVTKERLFPDSRIRRAPKELSADA